MTIKKYLKKSIINKIPYKKKFYKKFRIKKYYKKQCYKKLLIRKTNHTVTAGPTFIFFVKPPSRLGSGSKEVGMRIRQNVPDPAECECSGFVPLMLTLSLYFSCAPGWPCPRDLHVLLPSPGRIRHCPQVGSHPFLLF